MAVILSPRGNEASNMMKRFVRYEEAAQYFGIDETLIVAYAKAAGAVYQLSKIRLIKIEPLEDYMKHLTKVGRSSKLIQRKFVRVGEGTLIYNIGRNRFIEMARAAGAVYKVGNSKGRDKSGEQICKQKVWFRKFIELAVEKKKPLVIHCRKADDEAINILREYKLAECPGVIHCFSGNLEQARKLMDIGFGLGVNGMFTKMDEDAELCVALKSIPLEKIVFETDSPYLIPDGVAGKRNTSKSLNVIVEKFAELRGESPEHIREVVLKNTKRLYPELFAG